MKLSLTAAFLLVMVSMVLTASPLSAPVVSAQSMKCSLRLKIKDDATEKALTGAAGMATDKTSGDSIDAVAKEDELFFDGLTQSNTYDISFSRKGYKRTLVERYIPNCTRKTSGVIDIDAYMQKGDAKDVYLAGARIKLPDKGIINGSATRLTRPGYPPAARIEGVWGNVSVQVVIDEAGDVTSAFMISGHPTLKAVSIRAALSSKFKPTLQDGMAIKVTGIIVYNFARPSSVRSL